MALTITVIKAGHMENDKNIQVDAKVEIPLQTDGTMTQERGAVHDCETAVTQKQTTTTRQSVEQMPYSNENFIDESIESSRELHDITNCCSPSDSNNDPTSNTTTRRSLPLPLSPVVHDPSQQGMHVSASQRRFIRRLTILLLVLNGLAGLRALILFLRRDK